jgi:hypothetical protein
MIGMNSEIEASQLTLFVGQSHSKLEEDQAKNYHVVRCNQIIGIEDMNH